MPRQPQSVGASPPTAIRLSTIATSGCTRTMPRLSTTIAAPVIAATNADTVKPVPHGVDCSFTSRSLTRPCPLVERQRRRGRDVERIGPPRHLDPDPDIAVPHHRLGQPRPL